jgi:hypothetical protein
VFNVADRVESLTLPERIEVYRERAARMLRLARQCETAGVRLAYLKLAAHWQDLIVDLEQGRSANQNGLGDADAGQPIATDRP